MFIVSCDSCRKQVKNASKDVNYVAILDKAICMPCKKSFEDKVSSSMLSKRKYSLSDYQKTFQDTLKKMCK